MGWGEWEKEVRGKEGKKGEKKKGKGRKRERMGWGEGKRKNEKGGGICIGHMKI